MFRDIGCGAVLLAEMLCEGHSRSSGLIDHIWISIKCSM